MNKPTGKLKFAYSTIMAHEATIADKDAEITRLLAVEAAAKESEEEVLQELPSFEDILGIIPDFAPGISSEEIIREMRDAWD